MGLPLIRSFVSHPPVRFLFCFCCIVLTAFVLVPELFFGGKTKDYGLWFRAGQQVLQGGGLYDDASSGYMSFIYPPFSAVLLAIPSWFGKIPLYVFLSIVNSAAWWAVARLSNAMTGSTHIPGPWLAALPSFTMITFIFDQYDLGQPNLLLLAVFLFGFRQLRRDRWIAAGAAFGFAAAIKVFPITVLPYLVWRRNWRAAIGMIVFTAVFFFVVPGLVRGFDRNTEELVSWSRAMIGGDEGFGQRDAQNWSWVNQSIVAVVHRLARPVNYNVISPDDPPRYVNVLSLDREGANRLAAGVMTAVGFGFILLGPRRQHRTAKSDAEELGILAALVTIASPLARQYYFVWLFFPMTILYHRIAEETRPIVRRTMIAAVGAVALSMSLSFPMFPKIFQALGNNLLATFVVIACLAWYIHHPCPLVAAADAEDSPPTALGDARSTGTAGAG
jgi:hypothetical protein